MNRRTGIQGDKQAEARAVKWPFGFHDNYADHDHGHQLRELRRMPRGSPQLDRPRLTEVYYRPAIVAARNTEETRGSCRSIPEFHITDALDLCKDLLVRHGGHAAAAGFTVKNENLPELVARLKSIAKDQLGSRVCAKPYPPIWKCRSPS